MKLLNLLSNLITEAVQSVAKIKNGNRAIKVFTQEHQEENRLSGFGTSNDEDEIKKVFELGLRRRIPSKVISKSIEKHFDKIWENGNGLLRGGCSYKKCRLLFIDKQPGVGQIEYILQFYENSRAQQPTINAIIITSALSKEGEDYLRSLKTPTPKVRLGESVVVVYL